MDLNKKQAYQTHLNYINCLSRLTFGATLISAKNLRKANLPFLNTKDNLIKLTRQSLCDESAIVQIDKDYSYASTSWLPIKAYYLLFNILLKTEYLLSLDQKSFSKSHIWCVGEFTRKLEVREIQFSDAFLNQVFDSSILSYRVPPGANLSTRTNSEDMYKIALRKIGKYKEEDWKKKHNINLRKLPDKDLYKKYLQNKFKVSIFDFAYFMRIRSNYRDFAFIDGVSTDDTKKYFDCYFSFTMNLLRIFENLNIELANNRLSQ